MITNCTDVLSLRTLSVTVKRTYTKQLYNFCNNLVLKAEITQLQRKKLDGINLQIGIDVS